MPNPKDAAIAKFATANTDDADTGIDFITRYATDPPIVVRTLLDAARPLANDGARICELGFGSPGWLLDELRSEYPQCVLHGLDMSEPFVRAAHERHGRDVRIVRGDMDRLPFADASFDVVYSCWTLYFMPDIDAVLDEIRRTLRPGGRLVAATNAADHMLEYMDMAAQALRNALGREPAPDIALRFDLDNGFDYMRRHCDDVTLVRHDGEMVLTSPDQLQQLNYWYGEPGLDDRERAQVLAEFRRLAEAHIARHARISIRRRGGAFIATR